MDQKLKLLRDFQALAPAEQERVLDDWLWVIDQILNKKRHRHSPSFLRESCEDCQRPWLKN